MIEVSQFADCWYLTGPTAAGKTAVSRHLAGLLDAEILSLDSMAVYRGMDLGTAKPLVAERAAVPHHLLDLVTPAEEFSVAQYLAAAAAAVGEIRGRGRTPLFVGGSPLYLKTLLRGLFAGPPADLPLRDELAERARLEGPAALHRELAQVDPAAAERLHPNDARRLIRALEVYRLTGQPISSHQSQFDRAAEADERRVFVLNWPKEQLAQRINIRVDQMFANGLVDETRRLLAAGPLGRTAGQAVGYREVAEHLRGERDLPATIELVKLRTRQFAKRQMTWFRSLSECRMLAMSEAVDAAKLAELVATQGRALS